MQHDRKFEIELRSSNWMKHWLYALLMICLLSVGFLADLHQLFIMLLFPIGVAFNWVFFRYVSLASRHSIVGFEYRGKQFDMLHKDGSRWSGELEAIQWNGHLLTILKLCGHDQQRRNLVLFSDAADKETLRKFRVWLTTSV